MSRLYSFVLPAYKARFFKEAIDSILAQTYTNFELIIVNDASPEDLDKIVGSYNDPRIKYYKNEINIGGKNLVNQWNYAVSFAKGEYVVLASDDDIYHFDYLEKMDTLINRYPHVQLFRPRVQNINEAGNIVKIRGVLKEYTTPLEFAYWLGSAGKGIPFYIFKHSALRAIGGFVNYPLAWHSDDATIITMAKNGVVFSNEILFSFRLSGESISTKENSANILKDKILATMAYYNDLPSILNNLEKYNAVDNWYYTSLMNALINYRRQDIKYDFECSSAKAIIQCLPYIIKLKVFSFRGILSMYLRRFFTL